MGGQVTDGIKPRTDYQPRRVFIFAIQLYYCYTLRSTVCSSGRILRLKPARNAAILQDMPLHRREQLLFSGTGIQI